MNGPESEPFGISDRAPLVHRHAYVPPMRAHLARSGGSRRIENRTHRPHGSQRQQSLSNGACLPRTVARAHNLTPMALTMTLAHQNKMYNVVQPNCVIVQKGSTGGKRPLAPAPERSSVLVNNNNDLRCKRKIQFMPYGTPPQQPASVARRNARERNRVKQVNNGFATLRSHIPPSVAQALTPQSPPQGRGASKKLSKVETLRLAVEYIRSLQQMIEDHESVMGKTEAQAMDNRYYTSSSDYANSYPILLPTPSCSEASPSPSPSHSSEGSFSTSQSYSNNLYHHSENYENYDPKSPEDEELLDAIFSWQQE